LKMLHSKVRAWTLAQRLRLYARLIRLDRPVGFALLVWPTMWAIWLASAGRPNGAVVGVFVLGAWLMRSAGCAVNDWADREFDPHVARTRNRPLAAGLVRPLEALVVAGVLAFLAGLALLSLTRQPKVWGWAVLAVVVAATYPFFKRFFAVPQAYLGVAFGLGIPMAYTLIQDEVSPMAGWLMAANFFWTIAYDTEYAMVDREDDRKLGLRTFALTLGRWDVVGVMAAYVASLVCLGIVGLGAGLSPWYDAGLFLAGCLAAYHGFLIRGRDPERCFKAFRQNGWFGAIVFLAMVCGTRGVL
jgi:4-hydroxybenzoate polyprenyltransferase